MSLKSLTLKNGLNVTQAGDIITVIEDGVNVPGGLHIVSSDLEPETNAPYYAITARNRQAVLDAKTGQFGKAKRSISIASPTLVNGRVVFNTVRLELEVHPAMDNNNYTTMKAMAVQLLATTQTDDFWKRGSLS